MDAAIHLAGRLEPRDAWRADTCAMARALDVVRTKSAMLVLREAFYGATRFDEFVARTEASEPVVAGRLRELVADGPSRARRRTATRVSARARATG